MGPVRYLITLTCGCTTETDYASEKGEDWCCYLHGNEELTAECTPIEP